MLDQELATHDGALRLASALGITHRKGLVAHGDDSYMVLLWHETSEPEVTFWEGCVVDYRHGANLARAA